MIIILDVDFRAPKLFSNAISCRMHDTPYMGPNNYQYGPVMHSMNGRMTYCDYLLRGVSNGYVEFPSTHSYYITLDGKSVKYCEKFGPRTVIGLNYFNLNKEMLFSNSAGVYNSIREIYVHNVLVKQEHNIGPHGANTVRIWDSSGLLIYEHVPCVHLKKWLNGELELVENFDSNGLKHGYCFAYKKNKIIEESHYFHGNLLTKKIFSLFGSIVQYTHK